MRTLSIKQPYAELILLGKKTIETRTWNTDFRGEFLLHVGANVLVEDCKKFGLDPEKLAKGCIVGKAVLVDVKKYPTDQDYLKDSDKHLVTKETLNEFGWLRKKKYGFILENIHRIKPIEVKGQLGFFDVEIKL